MTKLIFWESGYLINILKEFFFFLRSYYLFKLCNVYIQGSTREGNIRKQTEHESVHLALPGNNLQPAFGICAKSSQAQQ